MIREGRLGENVPDTEITTPSRHFTSIRFTSSQSILRMLMESASDFSINEGGPSIFVKSDSVNFPRLSSMVSRFCSLSGEADLVLSGDLAPIMLGALLRKNHAAHRIASPQNV